MRDAALAIGLSIVVSRQLLSDRDVVLPSARGLADELWIVVAGFLYVTFSRVTFPTLGKSLQEKRADYMRAKFLIFRKRFGHVVSSVASDSGVEVTCYAIMIFEDCNRPALYRFIEENILFPFGLASTLGPMQAKTSIKLSDQELVRLGVEKVKADLAEVLSTMSRESPQAFIGNEQANQPERSSPLAVTDIIPYIQPSVAEKVASRYNVRSDYPAQVSSIFEFLRDTFYPNLASGSAQSRQSPTLLI
jgi:hypothetical protein